MVDGKAMRVGHPYKLERPLIEIKCPTNFIIIYAMEIQ